MKSLRFCTFASAVTAAFMTVAAIAGETLVNGVLTLDGVMKSVKKEAEFGTGVARVEMRNGGGVEFTETIAVTNIYSIAGDGLSATGIVSVSAGKTASFSGAELAVGSVGHTLVKRGAGTLYTGSVGAAAAAPTRFIVEEGKFECAGGDFWGGHSTANTNCVIDVREGATYDHGNGHGVVGPIELTGGTFLSRNASPYNNQWADASLDGGVTAHACETPSYMFFKSWGFLGHCDRTNCVFNVEDGARLIIDGTLTNSFTNVSKANRLIKRGGGELVLLKNGGWTGGTVLEGGTIVIANSMALSTGEITINGDVTINVLPGIEFVSPPVKGTGTITKTGTGIATFQTVESGITVTTATAAEEFVPVTGSVLTLNGTVVTVDVPAGETVTVTSVSDVTSGIGYLTDVVKTGAGMLVMPVGSENRYHKLIVRGGLVSVAGESCFGTDGVTLENGGGLRFTTGFTQARVPITCVGDAVLDIPSAVTIGFKSNYFFSAGATVTKNGMGTWNLASAFRTDGKLVNLTGTKWVVHEGTLKLYSGDTFAGAGVWGPIVLEAHEAGVISLYDGSVHTPLCEINLRGGEIEAPYAQFKSDDKLEGGGKWRGIGLQGPITVLPSAKPSRIKAHSSHIAHGTFPATTFDVQDGAVLEVCTMLQPGLHGSVLTHKGIVKRGAGTLKLFKPMGFKGPVVVEAGTLELGPNLKINDSTQFTVKPGAKIVLGDGSRLATPTDLTSKLCGSADVWFDASSINAADGAAVSSVPNRGTTGGSFDIVTAQSGYTPTAPTFVRNGINGHGTLAFNGYQALVTKAYTNRSERVSVFLVSKWTSWEGTGGKGLWGGPFSLAAKSPVKWSNSGDDNNCYGSLSYQHGQKDSMNTLYTYGSDGSISGRSTPDVCIPYLTHSGREAGKKIFTEVFWADGYNSGTNTGVATMGNCDMDTVCIGGRLRLGVPQIWNPAESSALNTRMYIGEIGEVLVFSRALTADEESTIYKYLKKKWFDVGGLLQAEEKELASEFNVEVLQGASASLAVSTTGEVNIEKTGTGALTLAGSPAAFVDVAEGTLAIKKGRLPSIVDVWIDASESSGMTFDDGGRVTNLVNRGACGGAFVRNTARTGLVPAGPEWVDNSINGLPALVFDGDSSLALYSYTNKVAPRSVSIYFIGERTFWSNENEFNGNGKWAGPFSLGNTTVAASDENTPGVITVQESVANRVSVDLGHDVAFSNSNCPATGEPYMMVMHSTTNGYMNAYEMFSTDVADVRRSASNAVKSEPLRVDIVQLATRTTDYGKPQWYGHGDDKNRNWFGKIGEFIVTTEPLGEEQERELFAYLRKKWLNKGTGSATAPEWLIGHSASPGLDAGTVLAMNDGTSLVHEGDPLQLAGLATDGTVDWTRVWDASTGADSATLFNVVGDVSLGDVNLALWPVPQNAKLVGIGGTVYGGTTWNVTGDRGAATSKVSKRADGFWIGRNGTVFYLR